MNKDLSARVEKLNKYQSKGRKLQQRTSFMISFYHFPMDHVENSPECLFAAE